MNYIKMFLLMIIVLMLGCSGTLAFAEFAVTPEIKAAPHVVDRAELAQIIIRPAKKQVEVWFDFGYMKNAKFTKFREADTSRRVYYDSDPLTESDEYVAIMAIIDPGGTLFQTLEDQVGKAK